MRSYCSLPSHRHIILRKSFVKENIVFKAKDPKLSEEGSGREFQD